MVECFRNNSIAQHNDIYFILRTSTPQFLQCPRTHLIPFLLRNPPISLACDSKEREGLHVLMIFHNIREYSTTKEHHMSTTRRVLDTYFELG